eukprot:1179276-Prorocentrum_minimum.AAC.1
MTDQSETGNPTVGLNADAVELTIKSFALKATSSLEISILPSILYGWHMSVLSPTHHRRPGCDVDVKGYDVNVKGCDVDVKGFLTLLMATGCFLATDMMWMLRAVMWMLRAMMWMLRAMMWGAG